MSTALGIALLIGAAFLALVLAATQSLVADEIRAWLPYMARRLARSAACRLPATSRARYEADWLGEIAAWEDRPLSALLKAAHIRWRAKVIRESLGGAPVKGERAKRAFDLLSASLFLALFSPLLLAAAIAIKLDSRGPVFVFEPRAGRDSETFELVRFRSMSVDAARGEARITRIGGFLRRSSLDELPQLFNVLKGDMSLVGPRPVAPRNTGVSGGERAAYGIEVRPGLTGIAQVRFFTSEPKWPEEVNRANQEYVRSRSFPLDLKLLMQTFWTVGLATVLRRYR